MAFQKSNLSCLFGLACFVVCTQFLALPVWAQQQAEANDGDIVIEGVVNSESGPIANAKAYVFGDKLKAKTVTSKDGKFRLQFDSDLPPKVLIIADGKQLRIQALDLEQHSKISLRLTNSKQPPRVKGRIIDNQGMSVADAKLRITSLQHDDSRLMIPNALESECFEASTDEDGRFQFEGFELPMIGAISVSGQGFVASTISSEDFNDEIVMVVQPARIVRGKVVDKLTNLPVTNATISAGAGGQQTQVNESGDFELTELPAFQPLQLLAKPNGEQPYLTHLQTVPSEQGFAPIDVKVELELGVWVKSKVKAFGEDRPAAAEVFYFPTPENENFQSYVESFQSLGSVASVATDSNGDAKVVAIEGPGVIAIVANGFPPNESVNKLSDQERAMLVGITGRNDLAAVAWIEPKNLKDDIELDFLVSKGRAIDIILNEAQLDATDPLVVHRAASSVSYSQSVIGNKFVADQFQPGESRQILIHAPQKRLGAVLNVKAESESPVKAELQSTGRVVGQISNASGEPQAGLSIQFEIPTDDGYQEVATQVFTDANGRFEKPSLLATLDYRIAAVRLTRRQQMMMGEAPKMDSRWYIAKDLKINSEEEVDLGAIVLGATSQPKPKRGARTELIEAETALPPFISGLVTSESGLPVANARVSFNTWPNRSGDLDTDLMLRPVVLAESRSDGSGRFQVSIDGSLEEKLIESADPASGKHNAAIVVVGEKLGVAQVKLHDIADPKDLKIQLPREMVVRGNISNEQGSRKFNLTACSEMRIYDVNSMSMLTKGLQDNVSLAAISETLKLESTATLDPLIGGLPLTWETNASGVFLVRNIPFNAIFKLHVHGETGEQKTITVTSRPVRGFEFKPTEDSVQTERMYGSRVRLNMGQADEK